MLHRVVASVCAAVVLITVTGAAPAGASSLGGPAAEDSGIHLTGERLPHFGQVPHTSSENLAFSVDSKSGRGFMLKYEDDQSLSYVGDVPHWAFKNVRPQGLLSLLAVDLRTRQVVAQTRLPGAAWVGGLGHEGRTISLDRQHRRIFVAYRKWLDIGPASGETLASGGLPCGVNLMGRQYCPQAIAVFDMDSLELVGDISLREVRTEGLLVTPDLLGMQPTPEGKLLMVLQERVHDNGLLGVPAPVNQSEASPVYLLNQNLTHLVQADATTGQIEWATRLDGCRGNREARDSVDYFKRVYAPDIVGIFSDPPDAPDRSVWVSCHTGSRQTGVVVRVPLEADGRAPLAPVGVDTSITDGDIPPSVPPVYPTQPQESFVGPDMVIGTLVDHQSGRLLLHAMDASDSVWWVFDTRLRGFAGTIGVGNYGRRPKFESAALDAASGRLYSLTPTQGLLIADIRGTPLAQAVAFPHFRELAESDTYGYLGKPLVVFADGEPASTTVYVPQGSAAPLYYVEIADTRPHVGHDQAPADPFAGRTLDLQESEGVTQSSLDGAARGFGARAIFVGGAEGVTQIGPADAAGLWYGARTTDVLGIGNELRKVDKEIGMDLDLPCVPPTRELVVGFVGSSGPAVMDGSGSRASTQAVLIDGRSEADVGAPVSRCSGADWEALWGKALFGRSPTPEPSISPPSSEDMAECVSGGEDGGVAATGDPVSDGFGASVSCTDDETTGYAYARALTVGGVDVAETLSSFRIYRDPARGIVSRVESVARGINLGGLARIGTVRGTAESWANGRRQPVAEQDRAEGYDPNCDHERTAGTCFQRHLMGVWTPAWSCGPCGDENQAVERLNRAVAAYASVRLRQPDPVLARGSENGYIAAVQKTDSERFAEMILNADLLQTVVPVLEIVRYASSNRPLAPSGPRTRQIYQFAGVETSSSYGIQCLLVYDAATNTCAPAAEPPGSLTVSLADVEGQPLAGGVFELRRDTDSDQIAGLRDPLVPEGACVTAADGVGTCRFDRLEPGPYLLSQTAAPSGHAPFGEVLPVQVESGEARAIAITNVANTASVVVRAETEDAMPITGAVFALYADPDADGTIAPGAAPIASCTTGEDGSCTLKVPLGAYVLVQVSSVSGLAMVEPIPFALSSGGQTASVGVVNYPSGAVHPSPSVGVPAPIEYHIPRPPEPTMGTVEAPPAAPSRAIDLPHVVSSTVVRVIRAPGDALRLLTRDARAAAAWTATLVMFALAAMLCRQRNLLASLAGGSEVSAPPRARAGGPPPGPPPSRAPDASCGRGDASTRVPQRRARILGGVPVTDVTAIAVLDRPVASGGAPAREDASVIRVLVASASVGLRQIVTRKLEGADDCELAGSLEDLDSLAAALRSVNPDALLVDLALLHTPGRHALAHVAPPHPADRTIGLITSDELLEQLAIDGYRMGLGGLLAVPEDIGNGQLCYALRCVAAGKPFYGPTIQAVMRDRGEAPARVAPKRRVLTRREVEVARLAVEGFGRAEIAARLFVSPLTIKRHLHSIRRKLGITNPWDREELRQRLRETGLLDDRGA